MHAGFSTPVNKLRAHYPCRFPKALEGGSRGRPVSPVQLKLVVHCFCLVGATVVVWKLPDLHARLAGRAAHAEEDVDQRKVRDDGASCACTLRPSRQPRLIHLAILTSLQPCCVVAAAARAPMRRTSCNSAPSSLSFRSRSSCSCTLCDRSPQFGASDSPEQTCRPHASRKDLRDAVDSRASIRRTAARDGSGVSCLPTQKPSRPDVTATGLSGDATTCS